MRRDVGRLALRVGYPGVFRPPSATAWFRHADPSAAFEANGLVAAEATAAGVALRVTVADVSRSLPAIASDFGGWEASADGLHFAPAVPGGAPAGDALPRLRLPLAPVEGVPGLFDVGREVLADLTFRTESEPRFAAGESAYEALHVTPETQEQTFATRRQPDGSWKTPLPLAFRFVLLRDAPVPEVDAAYTPLVYRRVYDFGDAELNRIWEAAAYTLRLCIMTFQVDGVKRDRLPWGGDLAISLLANAFSFREPEPVRRTLTVLGRDGVRFGQVNGILDYSLWIVISHGFFQDYFGDAAFLAESWPALCQTLDWFLARAQADGGLLRPVLAHEEDGVEVAGDWCFVDWVQVDKTAALQMLFHWALATGARLARLVGDAASEVRYASSAARLRRRVNDAAFDAAAGLYRGDVFNPSSAPQRHPNFLAVLSGVAEEGAGASIAEGLLGGSMPEAGTPYMISLELLALHRLGRDREALAKLRRVWGGMLALGATTFFEGYDEAFDEKTLCSFYARPFGMSLCHAWGSAPCALLPMIALGVEK